MKVIVTGGAGFIGSHLVRYLIRETEYQVMNLDCLTYAGNLRSLDDVSGDPRYSFCQQDISDHDAVQQVFEQWQPDWIFHLAAESHVDRSIDSPQPFIRSNITGTFNLLESARRRYSSLADEDRQQFRFLHVSTDEVYGSLDDNEPPFTETTAYDPRSPYSASKAAADHLARAWQNTWQLPVMVTNCSNNFGPFQFPEKLIPVVILRAIAGQPIPVYGQGLNIRDWLYVEDHVAALVDVARQGRIGETYNVGSDNQHTNIDLVKMICGILDELVPVDRNPAIVGNPELALNSYADLITLVSDRPGHDLRYAIDPTKIRTELDWTPRFDFAEAMRQTVQWYLDNRSWWEEILSGDYRLDRQGLPAGGAENPGAGS